jgi:hypothetical protein
MPTKKRSQISYLALAKGVGPAAGATPAFDREKRRFQKKPEILEKGFARRKIVTYSRIECDKYSAQLFS